MKILVVNNLFPPSAVGGYERLVALVAQRLTNRGHQVSVLTSDYGDERPGRDELPVERRLKLLVSRASIYEPFAGSNEERAQRNAQNRQVVLDAIAREAPDVVLVGNLYFLDRSVLEALATTAARTVFLLTDVWMIHFSDDAFLQAWFRKTVFELESPPPSLVKPDPPGLWLEAVATAEAWGRRGTLAMELERRRRIERELAGGRAVFQEPGTCHLCGPTTFRVEREGPTTLMVPARSQANAWCGRCGLDGTVRGTLHVLDALARPPSDEGLVVAVADPSRREALARLLPRCRVSEPEELDGTRRHSHAVCIANAEEIQQVLPRLAASVVPGGTVVAGVTQRARAERSGPSDEPHWPLLERARASGLVGPSAVVFWSRANGYLGRDHVAYAGKA